MSDLLPRDASKGAFPLAFALRPTGCNYDVFKGRHSKFLFLRRTCGLFSVFHLPAPARGGGSKNSPCAERVTTCFRLFFLVSLSLRRKQILLPLRKSKWEKGFDLICCAVFCVYGYLNCYDRGWRSKAQSQECRFSHDVNFQRRWVWLRASHAAHINCVGNGV